VWINLVDSRVCARVAAQAVDVKSISMSVFPRRVRAMELCSASMEPDRLHVNAGLGALERAVLWTLMSVHRAPVAFRVLYHVATWTGGSAVHACLALRVRAARWTLMNVQARRVGVGVHACNWQ
jgi:hypothetical protein